MASWKKTLWERRKKDSWRSFASQWSLLQVLCHLHLPARSNIKHIPRWYCKKGRKMGLTFGGSEEVKHHWLLRPIFILIHLSSFQLVCSSRLSHTEEAILLLHLFRKITASHPWNTYVLLFSISHRYLEKGTHLVYRSGEQFYGSLRQWWCYAFVVKMEKCHMPPQSKASANYSKIFCSEALCRECVFSWYKITGNTIEGSDEWIGSSTLSYWTLKRDATLSQLL